MACRNWQALLTRRMIMTDISTPMANLPGVESHICTHKLLHVEKKRRMNRPGPCKCQTLFFHCSARSQGLLAYTRQCGSHGVPTMTRQAVSVRRYLQVRSAQICGFGCCVILCEQSRAAWQQRPASLIFPLASQSLWAPCSYCGWPSPAVLAC